MRQSAFNGCFDEIRSEEGQRDGHVELPDTAFFSIGNTFGRSRKIGDEFVKFDLTPRRYCSLGRAPAKRPLFPTSVRTPVLPRACGL